MKHFFSISLFLLFSFALPLSANAQEAAGKRFDFSDSSKLKKLWQHKGKRFGVPQTKFTIVPCNAAGDKRVLEIKANRSTGFLATPIPESIWRKYPILRWRWRIIKKVSFPGKELDDQAAVVYFGDGTVVKNFLVGYRWEDSFALGSQSLIKYAMGATSVYRICMRNKQAEPLRWYVEERNVVKDFQKAFGRMPRGECALSIGANSQYSKSDTLVEIDFIEFRPAAAKKKAQAPDINKFAERGKKK
ncbi:MAG: DUF3047 domain-containing protein [Lentisphaeria bacterium]|nr:DUF3047 domain-containing protein [Lentisphaeria bacterium]